MVGFNITAELALQRYVILQFIIYVSLHKQTLWGLVLLCFDLLLLLLVACFGESMSSQSFEKAKAPVVYALFQD